MKGMIRKMIRGLHREEVENENENDYGMVDGKGGWEKG